MSSDIVFERKNKGNKELILFVHGFTGSVDTWKHPAGCSFPDLLVNDERINDGFDIATYEYYTKLFDLYSKADSAFKRVRALFSSNLAKSEKNICIEEISNHLQSVIRFKLCDYDNIYIISHSMGGLVAKDLIIKDFEKYNMTKVKLFISLAVPHQGAKLATFGGLISGNLQIGDLNPLSKFIIDLNQKWVNNNNKPLTKYFYGNKDTIVESHSAISIESDEPDVVAVDEDHVTICKPESTDSLVYEAVRMFLAEAMETKSFEEIDYQMLKSNELYNDELFVLKLLVADVHSSTINDAKELFLNAEYIRKLLKNRSEQKQLSELYVKIRGLYKNNYNKFLHGEPSNSGLLVSQVHEKITEEDGALLKSMTPAIKFFHKQGMLHQLSNDLSNDIWWTADKTLDLKRN